MNLTDYLIWIPVVAVFVAVISLISQNKRSKFALNVDLLLKLDDRFNTPNFRSIRKAAARSIRTHTYDDAEEIVDFFEMIGLLVRRHALDPELVWHSFFYWIHGYGILLYDHIGNARDKDATIWQDFIHLHEKVIAIEKRKRHCSDADLELSQDDLEQFVRNETTLK